MSCIHGVGQLRVEGMVERSSASHVLHLVVCLALLQEQSNTGCSRCPSLSRDSACSLNYIRQGTYLEYLQVKPVDGQSDDSAFV